MRDERMAFVKQCLPMAIDSNGMIKAEFKCPRGDETLAAAATMPL